MVPSLGSFVMTTTVPLNTALADLDESIKSLLKRELENTGFDGVTVAFDTPSGDWASGVSTPTVNAFLYDIAESQGHRPVEWEREESDAGTVERRPPLIIEVSFAMTAWARAVEDEHRLLSQVLSVLYAYPELPEDVLAGALRAQPATGYTLKTRVGKPRQDRAADFWSALGGRYKPSLDYAVTVACEPGAALQRGPEVRTKTLRLRDSLAARANVVELHRSGGTVRDGADVPVADAWVAIPSLGVWTASGPDGRFRLDRLSPGTYTCLARAVDGTEGEAEMTVPGAGADIVIGAGKSAARKRR
jgi:Pvc16 N-terminal domain